MEIIDEIIFLVITFTGGVISSTFGMGGSFLIIPLSVLFIPVKKVIALVTVFYLVSDITKFVVFKKYVDWKLVNLIWLGAVPGVLVGAFGMVFIPAKTVEKILGIVVLLYVMDTFFGLTRKIKISNLTVVISGLVYGLLAGMVGSGGGTIKAAVFLHLGLRKERFVGSMALSAILINLIKIVIFSRYSLISGSDLPVIGLLIIVAVIAALTGKSFVRKISPVVFEKVIMAILLIAGIKLLA